jgi:hypothetical protein
MRDQLLLALSGDTLTLHWVQVQRPQGWLARLRRHAASPVASTQPRASHTISLPIGQLSATLEQAWGSLKLLVPQDLHGADLSVQLGLAHARLGLLHQAQEGSIETKPAAIDSYVQAWIRQMWGVDPATQIIRWDRMENGHDLLISCIDHSVYTELEAYAQRHGLRFVSCKPAVLNALESPGPTAGHHNTPRTLIWTEPSSTAQRAALVQLLHCTGTQPSALWRGWVPAPEHTDTSDTILHGAIRRFNAAHLMKIDAPLVYRHWEHAAPKHQSTGAHR